MKSIYDLRNFNLYPQESASSLKYFKKNIIDFDVFLPTKGKNLQREYCWTLLQKQELIYSVIIQRHIPHMSFINLIDPADNNKEIWQVLDGKQRLSTLFDFLDNKFKIILEGDEYLFSELPADYRNGIERFYLRYYVVNEEFGTRLTDDDKIAWFKFINFAGTPQDAKHIKNL